MKFFVALYFLLQVFFSAAQDLNGFWKGQLDMRGGCFVTNNIELQISLNADSTVYGNSYHYEDIDNYVKKKFTGTSFPASKKIILQETYINTYKIPVICRVCIKKYELYYSRKGSEETLSGNWSGYMHETGAYCGTGPITLTRIKESAFKEVPEIEVDTGQIRLDFYDNVETDGDSISVLVNGRTVITHQKLNSQAITVFIKVDLHNTFQEVEMHAENLGSIPPNSALMRITAGKQSYKLSVNTDMKTNARIVFYYDGN